MTTEIQLQNDEYEDDEYPGDEMPVDSDEGLYEPYKSLSKAASLSVIMAFLSLVGLLFPIFLSAAAFAILLGVLGLRNLRRYPNELTGRPVALAGVVLGTMLLAGGTIMHTYLYMTEVPEGYERISFERLQPSESHPSDLPMELDGKRVFVKGYVHPGVSDMGEIKRFILVPDMGTCCFGGQPKLTDMIEVTITGPRGVRYAPTKRKLGGIFHIHNRIKQVVGGLEGGNYELEADYVR